jgi:hypothetical protein
MGVPHHRAARPQHPMRREDADLSRHGESNRWFSWLPWPRVGTVGIAKRPGPAGRSLRRAGARSGQARSVVARRDDAAHARCSESGRPCCSPARGHRSARSGVGGPTVQRSPLQAVSEADRCASAARRAMRCRPASHRTPASLATPRGSMFATQFRRPVRRPDPFVPVRQTGPPERVTLLPQATRRFRRRHLAQTDRLTCDVAKHP